MIFLLYFWNVSKTRYPSSLKGISLLIITCLWRSTVAISIVPCAATTVAITSYDC